MVFSLCAPVGWCDVCICFTKVIKVDVDVNEMVSTKRRPKTEDRRPKNEDPDFFARIRHGQLKNQAKVFLSANRCENNGDLRFVEKTP